MLKLVYELLDHGPYRLTGEVCTWTVVGRVKSTTLTCPAPSAVLALKTVPEALRRLRIAVPVLRSD